MAAILPTEEDPCAYRYIKLRKNEIRLAKLLPGKLEDPIVIKLYSATQLGPDEPKYEALSYAWGSRANPSSIQIRDGGEARHERSWSRLTERKRTYALSVTQSLEVALRSLRRLDSSRTLWVDAICIDQSNKDERSKEVLRMGDIYHWAERVVVWLGTAGPHLQQALGLFYHIGRNYEHVTNQTWLSVNKRDDSEEVFARYDICYQCHYSADLETAIEDLLSRAWFERLWIWQELCRAREVIMAYGDREIQWETFSTSVFCLKLQLQENACRMHSKQRTKLDFVRRIERISSMCYYAEQCWNGRGDLGLYHLLLDTQHSKCEDPRDRIYAQLSMLSEGLRDRIRPDYGKSTEEVYTDLFLQYCAEYGDLELVEFCGERPSTRSLPSWVPNWSVPRDVRMLGAGFYRSSGQSGCEYSVESKTELCVKGVQSATIAKISRQIASHSDINDVKSILRDVVPNDSDRISYPTGGTLFDAYCFAVVCGELRERCPGVSWAPALEEARSLLAPELLGHEEVENHDDQREYERLAVEYTSGRVFFTTAEGYIGLGPADIQASDIVCVFLGLRMPIILRAAENDSFKIIGCCYVHGLMDEKALVGELPTSWRVEYRPLRAGAFPKQVFVNSETGERTQEDPRLWELPPGWCSSEHSDTGVIIFENQGQDIKTWHDPRMTSEELMKHGVAIRTFRLI